MQTIELNQEGAVKLVQTLQEVSTATMSLDIKLLRIRAGDPSGTDGQGWGDPEIEVILVPKHENE